MKTIDDEDSWLLYPQHRDWFNKLHVAQVMRYKCGPCGVAPFETGVYVVRPIYNLSGMGIGARVQEIEAGDCSQVEPGYFWCEYLRGNHYSATYQFNEGKWKLLSCWEGINFPLNLTKFKEWKRSTFVPIVPSVFDVLSDVEVINIEFKDHCPFEVHLRPSPDPEYDHIIPIWEGTSLVTDMHYGAHGYQWIDSYDNGDGFLSNPRLGFWVK